MWIIIVKHFFLILHKKKKNIAETDKKKQRKWSFKVKSNCNIVIKLYFYFLIAQINENLPMLRSLHCFYELAIIIIGELLKKLHL